jgi:hypothetical protein
MQEHLDKIEKFDQANEVSGTKGAINVLMRRLILILLILGRVAVYAADPQRVDLDVGERLDLQKFDGPNIRLTITATDPYDVSFITQDYDHMVVSVIGGYGAQVLWLNTNSYRLRATPRCSFTQKASLSSTSVP